MQQGLLVMGYLTSALHVAFVLVQAACLRALAASPRLDVEPAR